MKSQSGLDDGINSAVKIFSKMKSELRIANLKLSRLPA